MGSIGDAYDSAMCEGLLHTLQFEFRDQHHEKCQAGTGATVSSIYRTRALLAGCRLWAS
jgi:hypothetical protein